jgi:D-alanyl-D-alanine carboxypeptidase (penicillin-binding protein 5/6)
MKYVLTAILILNMSFPVYASVIDEEQAEYNEAMQEAIETKAKPSDVPKVDSRYVAIIDRGTKQLLFSKNENVKTPMASTTKIMTAILLIENCDLNETVEVSAKAAGTGGSRLGLKKGAKITLNDLLYGLMLPSRK